MLTGRLLTSSSSASLYAVSCRSASKSVVTTKANLERLIPKHLLRNPKQELSEEGEVSLTKINKSIVAYLENARKHTQFMDEKRADYELGKRHLANIMGWNAETITQSDINRAINYLFPSGLFEKEARPMMLPPEEVYPKLKTAQYGLDGRPFNSFFYTGKPNYYNTLYLLYENYLKLNQFQDEMYLKGVLNPPIEAQMDIRDYDWLSNEEINKMLIENLKPLEYEHFIKNLNVLISHPYSNRCKDFIMQYTKRKLAVSSKLTAAEWKYTDNGIPYIEAIGKRKTVYCNVKVYDKGSGKFVLNDEHDIEYFEERVQREQLLTVLKITGMLNRVDIHVQTDTLNPKFKSALMGAIRFGVSQALRSFVDDETREKMRLAGLLTKDRRVRERKKPGLYRARKAHLWKAR